MHKCLACIWNDTQWSHKEANEMVQRKAQNASKGKHKMQACLWKDTQWSCMQANEMTQKKAQMSSTHME